METFEPAQGMNCPHLYIVQAEVDPIFLCRVKNESYCDHYGDETSCNHYNDIMSLFADKVRGIENQQPLEGDYEMDARSVWPARWEQLLKELES